MYRTVVLNVVGLTPALIGKHTPFLRQWSMDGATASIMPPLPAVTCTSQACFLTGLPPSAHGIVGNGWYFRDEAEIRFWRQSNHLVTAPKIWDTARAMNSAFTCTNMFWWYNMYSSADISVTPRPVYHADGRKSPDCHSHPAGLRDELQKELGTFPLFNFWGPNASIRSTQWIAEASKIVEMKHPSTLTLIYLPHLDYALQKIGPQDPAIAAALAEVDAVCAGLIPFFEERGARVVIVSEYGITPVAKAIALNRVLREHGLLSIREEMGRELLDAGASKAFAVADHQVAHIYINDKSETTRVRGLIEGVPGVERVFGPEEKAAHGLDHPRSGDLVVVAAADAWFTYYYWMDDRRAPDFARTVDIHRKPGYDPAELFLDPADPFVKLKVPAKLMGKALGFRYLMDVIPLDASLVKGSHGRYPGREEEGPLLITRNADCLPKSALTAMEVHDVLLAHMFGPAFKAL